MGCSCSKGNGASESDTQQVKGRRAANETSPLISSNKKDEYTVDTEKLNSDDNGAKNYNERESSVSSSGDGGLEDIDDLHRVNPEELGSLTQISERIVSFVI